MFALSCTQVAEGVAVTEREQIVANNWQAVLSDLARAKAAFQLQAIRAVLTEGQAFRVADDGIVILQAQENTNAD